MMEENEEYSPYCKLCDNCGEEGCCSHIGCFRSLIENNSLCKYGQTYLKEAIFAKQMYHLGYELYERIKNENFSKEENIAWYDKRYDEIWDNIYDNNEDKEI